MGIRPGAAPTSANGAPKQKLEATPAVLALKEWRLARARAEEVPAYVVFNDRTLAELIRMAPRTIAELAEVPGIGPRSSSASAASCSPRSRTWRRGL